MSIDEARELYGLLGSLAIAMEEDRYAGADIVRRAATRIWGQRDQPVACEACDLIGAHDEECSTGITWRAKGELDECVCSPIRQEYCHVENCKGGSALGEFGIKQETEVRADHLAEGDEIFSAATGRWHAVVAASTHGGRTTIVIQKDEASTFRFQPAPETSFTTRRGDSGGILDMFGDSVKEVRRSA